MGKGGINGLNLTQNRKRPVRLPEQLAGLLNIGGHGDFVWDTGSFADVPATGLETWFIRGGSAGAMLYKFRQPGIYAYVNHNLIEAVMLGATAHVVVDGEWNDDLMMQVVKPGPIT